MSDEKAMTDDELLSTSCSCNGPKEKQSAELVAVHLALGQRIGEPERVSSYACLLLRPMILVPDESGEHGADMFYEVQLSREQVHALARAVDEDWEMHMKYCGTDRVGGRLVVDP